MNEFSIRTHQRTEFIEMTSRVQEAVHAQGLEDGLVTVFIPHTTAGVMINENADPDVVRDLCKVFDKLVPWEDGYRHMEGNTASHAKAIMTGSSVQVPVQGGRLQLGTWQGIFFAEFDGPRSRKVWVRA